MRAGSKSGLRLEKMFEILVSHEVDKYYKKQDRDTKRRINKCVLSVSLHEIR